MNQHRKQTWDEMKSLFPNEWLLVIDFETDQFGEITQGIVVGNSEHKASLPAPPTDRGTIALEYTGESTFVGGLRNLADDNTL